MKWLRIGAIFVVLTFLYLKLPVAFRDYDSVILNAFYKIRGPVKVDDRVVIAAINDASIVEFGDWPWNRAKIAELVDSISACKPSVIILNFFFRKKSVLTTDEKAKEEVAGENKILAASLRSAGNVIIPFNFEKYQDEQSVMALEAPPPRLQETRIKNVTNTSEDMAVIPAKIIHYPEAEIAENAVSMGFNNVLGNTRHYALQAVRYGNDFYPSMALAAACRYLKTGMDSITLDIGTSVTFKDGRALPMDDYGISMINFCGPNNTFLNVTASEILGKNFNKAVFQDRIVIVGLTDKRNGEPNSTPYSDNLPASELWANVIENILSRNTPFILFSSLLLMLILPLLINIGLAFLTEQCIRRRYKTGFLLIGGTFALVTLLSFGFFLADQWLSVFIPLLYLAGLAAFLAVRAYRRPQKDASAETTTAINSNTAIFTPAGQLVRIGRYQVLQELGSGSMGTVYKAIDPKINRTIAIKTLKYAVSLTE